MSSTRRLTRQLCYLLTPLTLVAAMLIAYAPNQVGASSHREAPLISMDPQADATDFYMWITPDANDKVTIVANYIPFEAPEGAPNYYTFGDDVAYDINIDNVGDGKAHLTYRFTFKTTYLNSNTFLYNTGQITPAMVNNEDKTWSLRQTYSIDEIKNIDSGSPVTTSIATNLPTPPVNIGSKSTPNYAAIANEAIKQVSFGADGNGTVFAGQRDDPFWVDLQVFDLLTLRGGPTPLPSPYMGNLGYTDGKIKHPVDSVAGYNTNSIVLQVPISRLTQGSETVIGGWTTSSRRSTRVLNGVAGILSGAGAVTNTGPYVQVSRLGMPLTNEAVIPLALKDAFNNLKPEQDYPIFSSGTPVGNLLATSVLTPELQTLFKALYNVPNPGKPRTDILQIFLTGIQTSSPFTIQTAGGPVTVPAGTNVNKPANVTPAEMLRLNTATPFRPGASGSFCSATPSRLGLLGGDVCGFPNGRRLSDDVVEIELLAVAGAAYPVLTTDTSFTFDGTNLPAVLTDGVDHNDLPFLSSFPYVATPWSGQDRIHPPTSCTSLDFPCTFLPVVARAPSGSGALVK